MLVFRRSLRGKGKKNSRIRLNLRGHLLHARSEVGYLGCLLMFPAIITELTTCTTSIESGRRMRETRATSSEPRSCGLDATQPTSLSRIASAAPVLRNTWPIGDGRIAEVDTIVLAAAEWSTRKESRDPHWSATPYGDGLLVAQRFLV